MMNGELKTSFNCICGNNQISTIESKDSILLTCITVYAAYITQLVNKDWFFSQLIILRGVLFGNVTVGSSFRQQDSHTCRFGP